jgi:hypothetical protein
MECDKARVSIRVENHEYRYPLALRFQLIQSPLYIGGIANALVLHLADYVAWRKPLIECRTCDAWVNASYKDTFDVFRDFEFFSQLFGDGAELKSEYLPPARLLGVIDVESLLRT